MIIVDASIWIDFINKGDRELDRLLINQAVLIHPHVLGEVALGSICRREQMLAHLSELPRPAIAEDGYVLAMIERDRLWATGIGFTDAHLLASALGTPDTKLWTRDKRLLLQAERLAVAAPLS